MRQPSIVTAKAKLDLLALAGFGAVRVTSRWDPGRSEPGGGRAERPRHRRQRRQPDGMKVLRRRLQRRTARRRRSRAPTRALRGLRRLDRPRQPVDPRLRRRQRAEHQPLLAAAVRARRQRRRGVRLRVAAREDLRRAQGRLAADRRDRRRGLAARQRQPGRHRTRTRRRPSSPTSDAAYQASGRQLPIMDSFDIHPYEDNSSVPPSFPHPKTTTIAIADYGKLVALLGRLRRHGAARLDAADRLRRVRRRDDDPVGEGHPSTQARSRPPRSPSTSATQGRYYHDALALAFCQPNVKTFFVLPRLRRGRPDRWQSGLYYVDGTAKTSLADRRGRDPRRTGGVIAKCQGLAADAEGKGRVSEEPDA